MIRGWYGTARDAVEAQPIWLAWFVIFAAGASLNFTMGNELWGLSVGSVFAAVAVIGAYCAGKIADVAAARKPWLIFAAIAAFGLGQWCGWQQMGLRMTRGLGQLAGEAGQHNTANEALTAARAERAKIGAVRAVAAIAAEREFECKRTSRTYKDGKGPACTKLLAEEATAQRAAELDAALPGLATSLAQAPATTDPAQMFAVPIALGNAVGGKLTGRAVALTPEDVIFGFSIFMTALLEFFSTFGPWLLDLTAPRPVARARQGWESLPKQLTYQGQHTEGAPAPAVANGGTQTGVHNREPAADIASAGSHALHGAPMNFYIGAGDTPSANRPPALERRASVDEQADKQVAALHAAHAPSAQPGTAPPVKRAHAQELIDGLLAFRAACIVDMPGGLIPAADVYRRYAHWRGDRAAAEATFLMLIGDVGGMASKDFGGVRHFTDVGLRAAVPLAAVG